MFLQSKHTKSTFGPYLLGPNVRGSLYISNRYHMFTWMLWSSGDRLTVEWFQYKLYKFGLVHLIRSIYASNRGMSSYRMLSCTSSSPVLLLLLWSSRFKEDMFNFERSPRKGRGRRFERSRGRVPRFVRKSAALRRHSWSLTARSRRPPPAARYTDKSIEFDPYVEEAFPQCLPSLLGELLKHHVG